MLSKKIILDYTHDKKRWLLILALFVILFLVNVFEKGNIKDSLFIIILLLCTLSLVIVFYDLLFLIFQKGKIDLYWAIFSCISILSVMMLKFYWDISTRRIIIFVLFSIFLSLIFFVHGLYKKG